MGRDHRRKRSREVDDGGGERKKERETKGKEVEIEPVVVAPPTEDEVVIRWRVVFVFGKCI
ncbi:hypothetical protein Hdeb2414_s0002g00077641 [Helianthus debilis subsp. tardiflorus]